MRTIAITTRAKAMRMLTESLFQPGGTLNRERYCTGKYRPGAFPVGREVEISDGSQCVAIWSESRRDRDGAYCVLMGLYKRAAAVAV